MIVAEVCFENASQMFVIDDDHVIQALAPDAADHAFHVAILPGTSGCSPNLLDAHSLNSCPEMLAVDSIAISNHIPRSGVLWKCLNDLLRGPNCRGMFSDIEMHHAAPLMREDNEDIQHVQLNRRHSKEIDRYQLPHMISKERHPRLRGLPILRWHQS